MMKTLSKAPRSSLMLCNGTIMLVSLRMIALSPLVPAMSAEFGLTMLQSGFFFTANFISMMVFTLLSAVATEHLGRKPVITVCLLGGGIAMLLMAFCHSMGMALALVALSGAFSGALESPATALIDELDPPNATYNINIAMVFFSMGAMIGPFAAGLLIRYGGGGAWRWMFMGMGALYVLLGLAFHGHGFPRLSPPQRMTFRAALPVFRDKRFWLLCLCLFLYNGAEGAGWGWMSTFMESSLHLNPLAAAGTVVLFWLGMTIGRYISAALTRRMRTHTLICILGLLSAVVTLAMASVTRLPALAWVFTFLMGLSYSGLHGLIITHSTQRYHDNISMIIAIMIACGNLGMSVIMWFVGVLSDYVGPTAAMASSSVFFLLMVGIIAGLNRTGKRSAPPHK